MCGESAVTDQKWFLKFRARDFSYRTMLNGQVDQVKLIATESRHWEQSMLYHAGDSQHTQNIQVNKVIGENEKRASYFME